MQFSQDWIHRIEVGAGSRYIRMVAAVLAVAGLCMFYNWFCFRNFATQEAMDAAQVARNISEGRGYTTLFIKPYGLTLLKKRSEAVSSAAGVPPDAARLKENRHPDLSNPPVYPYVLAGWMKTYQAGLKGADWARKVGPGFITGRLPEFNTLPTNKVWQKSGKFWWGPDDFFIALFNQGLLFIGAVLTFFLARRLFDSAVGWTSGLLVLGSEYLWHFSVSGLSTMLLIVIFLGLAWGLVLIESEGREPKKSPPAVLGLAIGVGLLTGLAALTRYSFGWLIIPVGIFLVLFAGPRRVVLLLAALGTFAVVLTPWIYRNWVISGTPFGLPSYAVIQGISFFNENYLERSLSVDFSTVSVIPLLYKLLGNLKDVLQNDLPRLGGTWVTSLFLAGLLIGFRNQATRRLRYFVAACLGILLVVQALGRTQLSADLPEFNSENLLVVLTPLVLMYGVSLFFILLDQINLPYKGLRLAVTGFFGFLMCLPLVFAFLPPRPSPINYPPYNPGQIQLISSWMKPKEMIMSDIPWAVAWYGHRQCIWYTQNSQEDFFAVNDFLKPVEALYLSRVTTDAHSLNGISEWLHPGPKSWNYFLFKCVVAKDVPARFPLRSTISGFLPDALYLTDTDRWNNPPDRTLSPAD